MNHVHLFIIYFTICVYLYDAESYAKNSPFSLKLQIIFTISKKKDWLGIAQPVSS